MIELIFVIVILGILAAVAIPRLSATRDDAKISKLAANVSTLVTDAGSFYTSQGQAVWATPALWANITNVELSSSATVNTPVTAASGQAVTTMVYMMDGNSACFDVNGSLDGNLSIAAHAGATSAACTGAAAKARAMLSPKVHSFGGVRVVD